MIPSNPAHPRVPFVPLKNGVFRNFRTTRPVENTVIRQLKPNVGSYAWHPNTPLSHRTQPHERGSFFVNSGNSGMGMVGRPADVQTNAYESNAYDLAGGAFPAFAGATAGVMPRLRHRNVK